MEELVKQLNLRLNWEMDLSEYAIAIRAITFSAPRLNLRVRSTTTSRLRALVLIDENMSLKFNCS